MKASKITYIIILVILFVFLNMNGARAQENSSIPILMYHNLTANQGIADGLNVPQDSFKSQMEYLKTHGYNTIDFNDLQDFFEGKDVLPPNPIIITFDDGYVSNYTYGYPILKKYGYKAVIFMITSYIGVDGYLDIEMMKNGEANEVFDIQSHSVNHLYELSIASKDKMIEEVKNSKETLEVLLDKSINTFCYPYGKNTDNLREALKEQGYNFAVTTAYGVANKSDDHYRLKRIRVLGTDTGKSLKGRIERNTKNYTQPIIADIQANDKDLVASINAVQNRWIDLVEGKLLLGNKASVNDFIKGLSVIVDKEISIEGDLNRKISLNTALEIIKNNINIADISMGEGSYNEVIEVGLLKGLPEVQNESEDGVNRSEELNRRDIIIILTNLQGIIENGKSLTDMETNVIGNNSSIFIMGNYYSDNKNAPNELYTFNNDDGTINRITSFNSGNEHVLDVKELFICPTNDLVLIKGELLADNTTLVISIDIDSNKTKFVKKTTSRESIECIYWLSTEKFVLQIKDKDGEKIQIYDNDNILIEEKMIFNNNE